MIGPSSSHTAGAARMGKVARSLFEKEPKWIHISFYGSFAETYKGHGTDVAIIGGILNFDTADERMADAITIANKCGIDVYFQVEDAVVDHPNTVRIKIGDNHKELELVGISVGGGKIEIIELNGFLLKAILVVHNDRYGAIAAVSNTLSNHEINLGHMEVSRKEVGKIALMTIEVDQNIDQLILDKIRKLPNITQVAKIVDHTK